MENKRVILSEFVEKYNGASGDINREKEINNIVVDRYVPYEEKIAICEAAINVTSYIDFNGEKIYSPNSPIRYMLYVLSILKTYTCLEITSDLDDYNLLDQNNLIDLILDSIDPIEKLKFDNVFSMISKDIKNKEENVAILLSKKLKGIESFINLIPKDFISEIVNSNIEDNE